MADRERCRFGGTRTLSLRSLVAAAFATTAILSFAPVAWSAKAHSFTATYRGTGSGQVNGTSASGSATLTGEGTLIGASTLGGSARGVFTSVTCVSFTGTALVRGNPGSITLSANKATACLGATDANEITLSGAAKVVKGTLAFTGAHGTISFTGAYDRQSKELTITLNGRITY